MIELHFKTREEVHRAAGQALETHHGRGTLNIDTGVGKSKIVIDYIKRHITIRSVLITSPRTNLKANWKAELAKWGIFPDESDPGNNYLIDGRHITFIFDNIQSACRNDYNVDLIVGDEMHLLVTPEYGVLFVRHAHIPVIGLTATTDTRWKPEKIAMYAQYAPIIFVYLNAEEDEIVNKVDIIIVEHELDDFFRVITGPPKKQWMQGELKTYSYISQELLTGEIAINKEISRLQLAQDEKIKQLSEEAGLVMPEFDEIESNVYKTADNWLYKKQGTTEQKKIAAKYLTNINKRRDLLLSLASTRSITRGILSREIMDINNKILVFSERTKQVSAICRDTVHSNNKKDENEKALADFNAGTIRLLGSCYSLTLGLNMIGANVGIFESFMSSRTLAKQRLGRLHRISTDETARLYVIKIIGTQNEKWFYNIFQDYDFKDVLSSKEVLSWQLPTTARIP